MPRLAEAVAALPVASAILDGEIVAEDTNGISDFSRLQEMLKGGEADRLVCYCFDLLYLDGHDLTAVPLIARKALLGQFSRQRIRRCCASASISTTMANACCSISAGSGPRDRLETARRAL